MKNIVKLLFIGLLFSSCSESEFVKFDPNVTPGKIYFQTNSTTLRDNTGLIVLRTYADSLSYNFAGAKDDFLHLTLGAPVILMGVPVDYDRKISFKVNKKLTTAVEGVDFEVDYNGASMKAGAVKADVKIKLLRTKKLLDETLIVALDLIPNENFGIALEKYNNTNDWTTDNKILPGTTFRIRFMESAEAPSIWRSLGEEFFGPWTVEKYGVVNNVMDWTLSDWATGGKVAYGVLGYAAFKTQKYLQAEADAGRPVKERNGSYMQLGQAYAVDYSAYD